MTSEELSPKEIDRLYKLCVIPMLSVFYVILAYFVYLLLTDGLKTRGILNTDRCTLFCSFPSVGHGDL